MDYYTCPDCHRQITNGHHYCDITARINRLYSREFSYPNRASSERQTCILAEEPSVPVDNNEANSLQKPDEKGIKKSCKNCTAKECLFYAYVGHYRWKLTEQVNKGWHCSDWEGEEDA